MNYDSKNSESTLIYKDGIKYFLSKIIPVVSGFISIPLFMKYIGTENYGKYSFTINLLNMMTAFFIGWINQSTLRFYSRYSKYDNAKKAIRLSLVISSAASMVFFLIIVQGSLGVKAYALKSSIIILGLLLVINIYQFSLVKYQSQLKPERVMAGSSLQAILNIAVPLLLFTFVSPNFNILLIGLLLSYVLSLYIQQYFFQSGEIAGLNNARIKVLPLIVKMWKYGWPLSCWYASTLALSVIDRFFIQKFYSFQEVGTYSSLNDLITKSYSLFFFPITMALHARLMQMWYQRKYEASLLILKKAMIIQIIFFIICIFAIKIFSDSAYRVIKFILPSINSSDYFLIIPFFFTGFFWQFALIAHKPLELMNRTLFMLGAAIISLLSSIIGNYYLLPIYGIKAAAYVSAVSGFVYVATVVALSILFYGKIRNLLPEPSLK
ncbi:MAG: oligosaccharide flippase family protein [Anaerolineaceae bacterium]|nr:oligosaccharide flippase family protein [Anaerolineaceae bacterium]